MSGRDTTVPGAALMTVALTMALAGGTAAVSNTPTSPANAESNVAEPRAAAEPRTAAEPQAPSVSENPAAPKPWPAVPLPSLQSDPPDTVHLEACAVSIVGTQVSMDMSVSPSGDTPALLLESPLFGGIGASDPYPTRNFPELQIRIDGAVRTPEDRYEAYVGHRNITTMLRMTGMDPLAVTRTPPLTAVDTRNAPLVKALTNVAAVEKSGDRYVAKWQTRRVTRIPLEPAPRHHVEILYRARPAVSVMNPGNLEMASREKAYCLSTSELRRVLHAHSRSAWLAAEYTLPTSIDRRPAATVTLSMAPDSGDETPKAWLFFCGPHVKPVMKRGAVERAPVDVDQAGDLHVLRLVESTEREGR